MSHAEVSVISSTDTRLQARDRARIHQIGDSARSCSPGDNYDLSKRQDSGRDSRINIDNTNITFNTEGGKVVIEKLYLTLNMNDYWKMKAAS